MAVTFQLYQSFFGYSQTAVINLSTDTFKAVLTNSAPNLATHTALADVTQIANGNGYTTGGVALTSVSYAASGIYWKWTSANFEWTASGGSIGPFRYVPIYSDTSTSDRLVGMFDFGSSLTIPDGSVFRVEIGANGIVRFGTGTLT